jgi:hypothetical protein
MWGTSSPDDKLTGDLRNVIEATQIGGRRSDRLMAGKLSPGNFGLLQQYLPIATLPSTSLCLDIGRLDDRPPLIDLGFMKSAEPLRRLLIQRCHFLT